MYTISNTLSPIVNVSNLINLVVHSTSHEKEAMLKRHHVRITDIVIMYTGKEPVPRRVRVRCTSRASNPYHGGYMLGTRNGHVTRAAKG